LLNTSNNWQSQQERLQFEDAIEVWLKRMQSAVATKELNCYDSSNQITIAWSNLEEVKNLFLETDMQDETNFLNPKISIIKKLPKKAHNQY
jgi:hypothetical protein